MIYSNERGSVIDSALTLEEEFYNILTGGRRYFYYNYYLINQKLPRKLTDLDKEFFNLYDRAIEENKLGLILLNKKSRLE